MFKVAILSLLVLGCSALPYGHNSFRYGQTGFVSQPTSFGYGSGYGSGFRSGYSGLSTGFSGLGYGGLRSGYGSGYGASFGGVRSGALLAAPIATTSYVAPAVSTVGYAHNNIGLNLLNVRQGQQFEQVVPAAIQQISRTVEYRPFANQEQPIQAQVVEVEPSDNPVHLHFKTRSSTLSTSQSHVAAGPTEVQASAAQDEPQRLITEVQKPVIQEVKEVISPFRQVTQEINPVVESLHTIVTKGDGLRQQQYVAPAINTHSTYNTGYTGYNTIAAAPAISSIAYQTAPVVETVGVVSTPTIAVQSAPALTSSYSSVSPSYSGFQSGSYGTYGKQIGFTKPITTGFSSYSNTY